MEDVVFQAVAKNREASEERLRIASERAEAAEADRKDRRSKICAAKRREALRDLIRRCSLIVAAFGIFIVLYVAELVSPVLIPYVLTVAVGFLGYFTGVFVTTCADWRA